MTAMTRIVLLLALSPVMWSFEGRANHVSTVAGDGSTDGSASTGNAIEVSVAGPFGVVVGPDGALYVCEIADHEISRVDLTAGTIDRVVGDGTLGNTGDGGPALEAQVNEPYEVRFDREGHLYFVDMASHVVRRVDALTQTIETIAGTGEAGFTGDGGPATQAQLSSPHSIALDDSGNLYICDIGNHRVRVVNLASGVISTFAGTGETGPTLEGTPLAGTPLNGPRALDFDGDYSLFLALREGNSVFRIDLESQTLQHVAGTGGEGYSGDGGPAVDAQLAGPKGIAVDRDGNIFLADTESHTVRVIRPSGVIETLIGDGTEGDGPDGEPASCRLARPHGVCVDSLGRVFVGDSNNHRVRVWTPERVD